MVCFRNLVFLSLISMISCTAFAADGWPEWRGPDGQGHSDAADVPVSWSESENVAWKTEIPGRGWSTPVIENGQIWVTTAIDELAPQDVAERRRKTSTNSQPLRISDWASLRAVCVDLQSGKLLHDVEVIRQVEPQMIHIDNSYATPTPIIDDGRLYCHYGTHGMGCVDTESGRVLWTNRDLHAEHENGPGSSPILWNDLLIVHGDGIDQQYIVALDKKTGKQVWRTERSGQMNDNPQMRKAYATPLIAEIGGAPQIISPAADWVYGYDPATGRELWKMSYGSLGFSNSARPLAAHGLIYICTGFMKSQMLALKVDETHEPAIVWSYQKQVPNVSSPLLVGDEIYFASDNGIASCLDARTGELHWSERIGKKFWASPLYADGKIYFFDRDGVATVIAPGMEFNKLAANQIDGEFFATAAPIDGALILRSDKALYRVEYETTPK